MSAGKSRDKLEGVLGVVVVAGMPAYGSFLRTPLR